MNMTNLGSLTKTQKMNEHEEKATSLFVLFPAPQSSVIRMFRFQ